MLGLWGVGEFEGLHRVLERLPVRSWRCRLSVRQPDGQQHSGFDSRPFTRQVGLYDCMHDVTVKRAHLCPAGPRLGLKLTADSSITLNGFSLSAFAATLSPTAAPSSTWHPTTVPTASPTVVPPVSGTYLTTLSAYDVNVGSTLGVTWRGNWAGSVDWKLCNLGSGR